MHDHPTTDDYQWPTCTAPRCGRQLWVAETGRWICRPCEDATATRLAELPGLYARLDTTAMLMRGARRQSGGASGTKTPPIPPRLEVLALVGPGGVAARLSAVEDAWRQALGWTVAPWRGSAAQALPEQVTFLRNNLLWAASSYDEVGQDVEEIRRLHAECTALASGEKRPGRVAIGHCPVRVDGILCGEQLTATTNTHRVRCHGCGTRWDGLGEWRDLRAAQEAVLVEMGGAAA
ncbi:hypothetical protein [Streptomyces sp. NPDC008150]|uniref:hypothetical protein n=1 Tax=Streptomyces sp. NPDC008150 TaxID=3364816 RepID=UPI0036E46163